jgi:formyltetrahydrofolate-dependent phosphoribosylglycinamide formyltransferase
MKLAVLVSGSGTILESMIDRGIAIDLVVSDRSCRGSDIAATHGIESLVVPRDPFGGFSSSFDRGRYSQELAAILLEHNIDLIAMAGFGTIVDVAMHDAFPGRILNTHPSLLPAFRGWHAVRDALAAGVTSTGCTVHIATPALDDGPILAQERVLVLPDDDESTLHERIKLVERNLYPTVVAKVMTTLGEGREPITLAVVD